MATQPHDINLALARCDLERLVRQHIHDGVQPGRLLEELLDMCVNLRDMARLPLAGPGLGDHGTGALVSPPFGAGPASRAGSVNETAQTGCTVRWLRPVGVAPGSDHEDDIQG